LAHPENAKVGGHGAGAVTTLWRAAHSREPSKLLRWQARGFDEEVVWW
jgi:hypothetical protein